MPSEYEGVNTTASGSHQLSASAEHAAASESGNPYQAPSYKELHPRNLTGWPVWKVALVCGVVGLLVGIVSRIIRPLIPGPIHYESIVGGAFLVLTCCVASASSRRIRQSAKRAFQNATWVSVATWSMYFVGWTIVNQQLMDDLIGAAFAGAAVSIGLSVLCIKLIGT